MVKGRIIEIKTGAPYKAHLAQVGAYRRLLEKSDGAPPVRIDSGDGHRYQKNGVNYEKVTALINRLYGPHYGKPNEKTQLGTDLHALFHAHLSGGVDPALIRPHHEKYFENFLKACVKLGVVPGKARSEVIVFDDQLRIAGTMDIIDDGPGGDVLLYVWQDEFRIIPVPDVSRYVQAAFTAHVFTFDPAVKL